MNQLQELASDAGASSRSVLKRASRHWNSAFSLGVGYEPQPPGSFVDDSAVRGYFIDFRAKTISPSARAPDRLLPTGLAQLALGWWDRWLGGEALARSEFERVCSLLEATAERRNDELRWRYEVVVPKFRIDGQRPSYSAMAQAQVASVFVRAYSLTEDARHAEIATAAVRPLLHLSGSDLVYVTDVGPVLEEATTDPPSHILNGWIYALWGLWDMRVGLGSSRAEEMLTASVTALRRMIDRYDTGWWSKYSLYPYRIPDLAKPFYHRLHIDQCEILYRLTGFPEFGEVGRRWEEYDKPARRIRVVAQKAVFVASRYA